MFKNVYMYMYMFWLVFFPLSSVHFMYIVHYVLFSPATFLKYWPVGHHSES